MVAALTPQELVTTLATAPPDHPDRAALRDRAIEAWLPLAWSLARRYRGRGEPADDLTQVAVAGLIESVDRFRVDRGADFVCYAIPTVLGALRRYFRDRCWSVRVPRHDQDLWLLILSVNDTLTQELGRAPTTTDLASRLSISEGDVRRGLKCGHAYRAVSLSAPYALDRETELGEFLGADDRGYELTEIRMTLREALARLDEREWVVLSLYFYDNLTQRQIGERIGVTQMHVSRLLAATLRRLRHFILEAD
jgi:RNA polymerase sigma-B factor